MQEKFCKAVYIIALLAACGATEAQVSVPSVGGALQRLPSVPEVDRPLRQTVDEVGGVAMQLAESWIDTAELSAEQVAEQASRLANGTLRQLQVGRDPGGSEIEDRVVIVLAESKDVTAMALSGSTIVSRRELQSLGLTMLTLRVPASADLESVVGQLRTQSPNAAIDFNHIYDFTSSQQGEDGGESGVVLEPVASVRNLRIGIIDSAVMPEHRGLADVEIISRDFVTTPGLRPQTHGTAVASLIARSAGNEVSVYAASVFFQLPNRAPGATAESLVAALDWLVEQQVDVINMSLAGPGNDLLEAAIARLVAKRTVVIAAVGNNGPSGDPLYPAAYEGVIGITAVDRKNKVFRYANRGEQVQFAAVGVDVKVADSLSGGWRIESGTSMASPHVAVVAAQLLRSQTVQAGAVTSWLMANCKDLGRKGFDPVYGHGLVTQPPIVLSSN